MRAFLPISLAIFGIGLGGGAGYLLRPSHELSTPECSAETCPDGHYEQSKDSSGHAPNDAEPTEAAPTPSEFVKLNNQFIVPDIKDGVITSLIVLSLSIEVSQGSTEKVFTLEPKLRDVLLQVLFDHANAGGFRGDFTSSEKMDDLRRALLEAARKTLSGNARSVLISDIVRQDTD